MPRSKVKLAFIRDLRKRKTSFTKRKECLMKKLEELSILCGIEACAIIYSPFKPQIEVWPNDNIAFQNVLNQFMTKSPLEKIKNMVNQESYIKKRISKVKEQINKQIMVNRDMMMANMMSECLSGKASLADLNLTDLKNLVSLAGHKLSEIEKRIRLLKIGQSLAAAPPPQSQEVVGGSNSTANDMVLEGMDVDCYVPVMENTGALDGIQTTGWYPPDWIANHVENDLGLVPGVDMMMLFPDDPNPLWSGASFPKTS